MYQQTIRLIVVLALCGTFAESTASAQQRDFPPLSGMKRFGASSNPKVSVRSRILLDASRSAGVLQVVADVPKEWHIFSVTQPDGGPMRTEIELAEQTGVRVTGDFSPQEEPERRKSEFLKDVIEEFHEGEVIWSAPIEIADGTDLAQVAISGEVKGQICSASSCLPLDTMDTTFTARFDPSQTYAPPQQEEQQNEVVPTNESGISVLPVGTGLFGASWATLLENMAAGVVGGLILNLMPCVLPVIGLKLMSFVEQAQGSRWEALRLNLIYSAGILSVFIVLATLAVTFNLGWGEQFTNTNFKLAMVVLVFAMALSFLGVWEIPIPGFVGRGKSQELAAKEGVSGAFFKGVFTTILATPCSGPFLGPVFAYTVKQPPAVTYVIMLSVGVGLALPYLIIGAFPALIRWIPRPGAWMDTFKQLMGFVLLGTTVYLVSTINESYFVPTLATMFGVWFGCWWIGRIPITASFDRKLAGWIGGIAVSVAIGFFSFNYLARELHLDWSPYSDTALAAAADDGKTIMVDFTADWCLTCQLNTVRAIDTPNVNKVVEELGVIPLLADYTDQSDEIKRKLAELDSVSIPLLAIYPAGEPDNPIVLRDVLSEEQVLDALRTAGPSRGVASTADAGTARRDDSWRATSSARTPLAPTL